MERSREERIADLEFDIGIWKENQRRHLDDEPFFHYTQGLIDKAESELDILTRAVNWDEYI